MIHTKARYLRILEVSLWKLITHWFPDAGWYSYYHKWSIADKQDFLVFEGPYGNKSCARFTATGGTSQMRVKSKFLLSLPEDEGVVIKYGYKTISGKLKTKVEAKIEVLLDPYSIPE